MNIAYFDCFSGAAGDMILGALIDAGASPDALQKMIRSLPVGGYRITVDSVQRGSIRSTRFQVELDPSHAQPARRMPDIREIITSAPISTIVRDRSLAVFQRLANAESQVHGCGLEKVHFHEVGAVDAIIDIVGTCWAVEQLGIERIVCSPLPVGSGTVHCDHGEFPVPAPATALLLEGYPIASTDDVGELVTPTGAAVLTTLAHAWGPIPPMTLGHVGNGAGSRDDTRRPNIVRVLIGTEMTAAESDRIAVIEANLDDCTPEVIGYTIERLLEAGALDAYCQPIYMKKMRPAYLLTVLAGFDAVARLKSIVWAETTTFGVRCHDVSRTKLTRRRDVVETPYGTVHVKIGLGDGHVTTVSAEYDDCRDHAKRLNVPLHIVMDAAVRTWNAENGRDSA